MADSEDEKVWTYHAKEQWEENKTGHKVPDDDPFRVRLLALKDEVTAVVDLGCGGALWRDFFRGFHYTGIDQNAEMIRYAKLRWPDDVLINMPGEATGLPDESVQLVFTSAVIQHNRHPRKSVVLNEIYRILKPGGYYLCTENTFRPDNYASTFGSRPYSDDLDDGYSFTPSGWERFLSAHKFDRVWYQAPSEYLYKKRS